jgi:hypothetical protein
VSRFDALRARVEYPASWRPESGDTLLGEAVGWSDYEKTDPISKETKTCRILTVRDESGLEHGVWLWHSVLRQELERVNPGDLVAISYVGKRPRQSGDGAYHHYRVAVEAGEGDGEAGSTPVEPTAAQDGDIPF